MGRSTRVWIPVLGVAAACIGSDAARGVTQVEVKSWSPPAGFSMGILIAQFDARVTGTDLGTGVAFSLQERDPGGNDLIASAVLPWSPPYPALGAEIRVRADFRVSCSAGGVSGVPILGWHVTWCDLTLGTQVRSGGPTPAQAVGASEPENFEFAIADENGVEGAHPTPEDAYTCGGAPAQALDPVVQSPYDLVQAGLPVATQTDAAFFPRVDPELQSEFAGTIGLYFDSTGQVNCGDIPAGTSSTLYVVARTAGPTRCGITGAELRLDALPAGWIASVTIPPNAIQIGDPLTSPGGNMAFRSCQPGGAGFVLLYTIPVFATSAVSDHVVDVVARNPPANPEFACPLVTLCDVPNYSIVCMTGGQARINPPAGPLCDIPIAVEPRTWSGLKRLYE